MDKIILILAIPFGVLLGILLGRVLTQRQFDIQKTKFNQYLQEKILKLETENKELIFNNHQLEKDNLTLEERKKNLEQVQGKFQQEFENLSRKILEDNSNTLAQKTEKNLTILLNPLRERLVEFQHKVDKVYNDEARERFSLKNEINKIIENNQKSMLHTENLTKALKGDNKLQGNWGEIQLEKILEESGLRKREDYIQQASNLELTNEDGHSLKPDIVVNLPENKHIIIDSKVSLTAYERYYNTDNQEEQQHYLKEFLSALKRQIKNLSAKQYHAIKQLTSPDFVLMFMPIEAAYMLAISQDIDLHKFAWDKKVIMVSPATLLTTLKTIAYLRILEKQQKNATEIAVASGKMYDHFVGFIEDLSAVGNQINKSRELYDKAFKKLSTGNGNLIRRAENIKSLGAKTNKKLDDKIDLELESSPHTSIIQDSLL